MHPADLGRQTWESPVESSEPYSHDWNPECAFLLLALTPVNNRALAEVRFHAPMDRPQNDSDPSIQHLLQWVESTPDRGMRSAADVKNGYDWNVPYISQAALAIYFSKFQAVEKLLIALFGNHPSRDSLNAHQIKENYCKIFCLLISIGKGQFITQFVENGIDDHNLPLQTQPPDFPSSASDPHFFSAFYREQWKFCPHKLHADTFNRQFKAKEHILPIRKIAELGEGGSATAFKVEVPDCYNSFQKVSTLLTLHNKLRTHNRPNLHRIRATRITLPETIVTGLLQRHMSSNPITPLPLPRNTMRMSGGL